MSLPLPFHELSGLWQGTKKLYMQGASGPAITCTMRMRIAPAALGCFDELAYTWSYEGKPCEGALWIGFDSQDKSATAAWIDSFHQSTRVMPLGGTLLNEHTLSVAGTYSAPPGQDWGWRIALSAPAAAARNRFALTMYNVFPDGNEELAVVMELERDEASTRL